MVSTDWPVVVELQVFLKPGAGDALTLAGRGGPWSDAVRLECTGRGAADRSALFLPAFTSNRTIELTRQRSGLKVWVAGGPDRTTLPEGTWQIRAVLDGPKLGDPAAGEVASNTVEVSVKPAGSLISRGDARRKCLATMKAWPTRSRWSTRVRISGTH